jgi:dolichol-phosphate mannosyltransferase
VGFRQTGIPIKRGARHSGRSKYSLLGLITLAADGVFAFSIVPIRAAALLGAVVMVTLLYVCYSLTLN